MKRVTWAVVLLGLLGPGCGKTFKQVQLTPSKVATTINQKSGHEDLVCGTPCVNNVPVGCNLENSMLENVPSSVLVGHSAAFNPGTPPCDCWNWVSCSFRGYVQFDMAPLPAPDVMSASLSWGWKTEKAGRVASNDGFCAADLYVAEAPWGPYKIAGSSLGVTNMQKPIDVSNQVRQWAKNQLPNFGFFLVGPNESLPAKSKEACMTQVENIKLDLLVAVPKPK